MNHKKYYIFLDDERMVEDVIWLDLPYKITDDFSVVRTGKQFKSKIDSLLKNNELPKCVTFDYGLEDFQVVDKSVSRLNEIEEMWDKVFHQFDKGEITYTEKMLEVYEEKSLLEFYLKHGKENKGIFDFGKSNICEITGKSCLDYFCDCLLDLLGKGEIKIQDIKNIQVFFHTQNNVGKKNMESYWFNFLKHIENNF